MDPQKPLPEGEQQQQDFWQSADQILKAGEQAAQLLNSPLFNHVYRQQMEDTVNQWLTCEPKEVNKRESLYYQARAQQEMATRMATFIEQAQVMKNQLAENAAPDVKRSEYLDGQGFIQ